MTENNPNENKPSGDTISDQLNELGKNLLDALTTAWQSQERRQLQKEIEDGIANLGATLSQAAKEFTSSPTGQTLKDDVKDLQERWRSGEVGSKMHAEVLDALHRVNEELQKTTRNNPPPPPSNPQQ